VAEQFPAVQKTIHMAIHCKKHDSICY